MHNPLAFEVIPVPHCAFEMLTVWDQCPDLPFLSLRFSFPFSASTKTQSKKKLLQTVLQQNEQAIPQVRLGLY